MLQKAWRLPTRKLVVAMPLTCVIVAVATHAAHRSRLGRVLPARRAAVADRPGALVVGGHQPARAAGRAALAQSRVRPQRRARAARRARVPGRGGGPGELRVVAVRAPGRDARLRVRDRHGPAGRGADAAQPGDSGAPAVAVRARRGVRDLRRHGRAAARGQRADRGVRVRDHARHPPPRPAPDLRGARRRHRRDRQARRVRRVRLAAHARRAVRRRLGRGRDRRDHAADRPAGGDRRRAAGHQAAVLPAGVHGLVRPQGRGHDDVLAARARRGLPRRRADLQPRRAVRVRLDPRPRADRHAGLSELGSQPQGRSAVQSSLLLGARERPGGLAAALLAEHEPHLRRRPQPVRMVGPERRARLVELEGAEAVAGEEALLARHLRRPLGARRRGNCGHPRRPLRSPLRHRTGAIKAQRRPGASRPPQAPLPQNAGIP